MDGTERTPAHLWIVGGVGLLWNAYGCYDYVMTQIRNEAHLASFSAEERAYFEGFPAWLDGAWAFGVWGALIGSLLLLMRSRHAVTAFALSLAGLAVSTAYHFMDQTAPHGMDGNAVLALHAIIWAAAIFFLVYALRMRRRGLLR
jgi:hypothetical protein